MATVADVQFPCLDCRHIHKICGKRDDVMKLVFFAIGHEVESVDCSDYEERTFHGLEGVRA